jgi:WD40 repeat protein
MPFLFLFTLFLFLFPVEAVNCTPLSRPDNWTFDGVILTYEPDEGVRALRSSITTTYYIAFEGSNFTGAGAVSPDGKWFALPYGYIQTAASSDVRYRVNELRVHSTEPVPRIVARMAWNATFQFEDGIAAVRWLDNDTFFFASGAEGDLMRVSPFTQDVTETDLDPYIHLSPDLTRGVAPHFEGRALFDLESGEVVRRFPALPSGLTVFAWTPDSSAFVTVEMADIERRLVLYNRDGGMIDTLYTFGEDQLLWNFRWSPDGERLAFSLYDPYKNENFLYLGDRSGVIETCIRLNNLHDGAFTSALAWSPDGTQLALLGFGNGLLIYDVNEDRLIHAGNYSGGLLGWGAGEF